MKLLDLALIGAVACALSPIAASQCFKNTFINGCQGAPIDLTRTCGDVPCADEITTVVSSWPWVAASATGKDAWNSYGNATTICAWVTMTCIDGSCVVGTPHPDTPRTVKRRSPAGDECGSDGSCLEVDCGVGEDPIDP